VNSQTSLLIAGERRRSLRYHSTIPAQIYVRDGLPLCPCTVLDVSQGGGRIRLDAPVSVPDQFHLLFTRTASVRRECRVIWRHDDCLGVAFSSRFDHAQEYASEHQST
jgi:hypothetical protein